jgi:DNA-binding response OmpR family regulator
LARILVVEDEEPIAQLIEQGLEEAGHSVDIARDGCIGLSMASEAQYSLIVLDIMLPKLDGWCVCRELRASRSRVPILMLTARDGLDDRIRGLDLGADDYLAKPFQFGELLARVRALLRRDKMHRSRVIRVADLEIDTGMRDVRRAGQCIHLTPKEYALLEALAVREGTVVSREIIQEQVWMDDGCFSNEVDVYIGRLRRKVDTGNKTRLIRTIHRSGYMISSSE